MLAVLGSGGAFIYASAGDAALRIRFSHITDGLRTYSDVSP